MRRENAQGLGMVMCLCVIVVASSAIAGSDGPKCLEESFSQACDWVPPPVDEACPHEILVNGDCFKTFPATSGFDTKQGSSVLCRYQKRIPLPEGGCETLEPKYDYSAACDRAVGKVCSPPEPANP